MRVKTLGLKIAVLSSSLYEVISYNLVRSLIFSATVRNSLKLVGVFQLIEVLSSSITFCASFLWIFKNPLNVWSPTAIFSSSSRISLLTEVRSRVSLNLFCSSICALIEQSSHEPTFFTLNIVSRAFSITLLFVP